MNAAELGSELLCGMEVAAGASGELLLGRGMRRPARSGQEAHGSEAADVVARQEEKEAAI